MGLRGGDWSGADVGCEPFVAASDNLQAGWNSTEQCNTTCSTSRCRSSAEGGAAWSVGCYVIVAASELVLEGWRAVREGTDSSIAAAVAEAPSQGKSHSYSKLQHQANAASGSQCTSRKDRTDARACFRTDARADDNGFEH